MDDSTWKFPTLLIPLEDVCPYTTFFTWLLFMKINNFHIQCSTKCFSGGKNNGAFCFSIIKSLENLQLTLVLFVIQTAHLFCAERLSSTWRRKNLWKVSKWFTLYWTLLYCLCHNIALCPKRMWLHPLSAQILHFRIF